MAALGRLIKAMARLPGMNPPCQLWDLFTAAGHLCRRSEPCCSMREHFGGLLVLPRAASCHQSSAWA